MFGTHIVGFMFGVLDGFHLFCVFDSCVKEFFSFYVFRVLNILFFFALFLFLGCFQVKSEFLI